MKLNFIIVLLSLTGNIAAQRIIFDKGTDTLISRKSDTIYRIGFRVTDVQIGSIPLVRIKATNRGTAKNGVVYAIFDMDSTRVDSVTLKVKSKSGFFMVFLASGLTDIKSVEFAIEVDDGTNRAAQTFSPILIPFKETETKKEAVKKDSLVLTMINDLNIVINDTIHVKRFRHLFYIEKVTTVYANVDSINVEKRSDGKYGISVVTTDGEAYFNNNGLDLQNWDRQMRLQKNGSGKPYLSLSDILSLNEDKKENQNQSLTPQKKAIKISKY